MANTMTSKNISSHVNLSHCSLCQGDTEYYCLTCEQNLCPMCKTKHSINLDTNEHNITLYKYKSRLPSTREPCNTHPNQHYEKYCEDCALPFCVDCPEHNEHSVGDLITVYKEQKKKFNKNSTDTFYFLQVLLAMIKSHFIICKNKMSTILSEMSRELQRVKDRLDTVSIEACIKRSLHKISRNQTAAMKKHLSKIKLFDAGQHKFVHKPTLFICFIKKTPSFHINVTPLCVQHLSLDISTTEMDVQFLMKLLNKIQYTERGKRKIRNEELLGLISVPELQKSSTLENFSSCEHISSLTRDRVWISEQNKLVLIDIPTGNIIHTLTDVVSGSWRGLHTVNNDRDLFYISDKNSIVKLSSDRKTATTFINMKDLSFEPRSVYCTPSTGDLLIGVRIFYSDENGKVGKVARFDKTGKLTMTIPKRYKRPPLFKDSNYITENNNGDIVVSDYWCGVVVTDRVGKHLFSYKDTPFGLRLLPRGICTDALSHILVCDFNSGTVLILDKEGNFLLYIPTQISLGHFAKPCSLNYDWNNHQLWIGSWNNTVSRYRHINRHLVLTDNSESCADYDSDVSRYFNNPMHLQELESILSICRRGFASKFELEEEPTLLNNFLVEVSMEMINAGDSLKSKYHISMAKAYAEVIKVLLSRINPEIDTHNADVMMKTDAKNEKEEKLKTISLEMGNCALNVAQTCGYIDIERIIMMRIRKNDSLIILEEIMEKVMEKYKMPKNNENASVQDFMKHISETSSPQDFEDIVYLVMDVLSDFTQ